MRGEERGAATLLAVVSLGLLVLLTLGLGAAEGLVVSHRRAQAAADLAALGGAGALATSRDACGAALSVAEANAATLSSCRVVGDSVSVEVAIQGPTWWGRAPRLTARARAGPAAAS